MIGYSGYGEEKGGRRMKRAGQLIVKRILDIVISTVALIMLFPLMAFIALAIKLDSKGPVFFRQERVGKDGKTFKIWKFRTMSVEAPAEGFGHSVTPNNPYLTRVGRFLREWGLDELPQLINVLRGEMSLVGPRPAPAWQVERYTAGQRARLSVKPGITGWALIHGRNRLPWRERIELDLWYVKHWSLWLDIKILFKTLWVVLVTKEGVYGAGEEVDL